MDSFALETKIHDSDDVLREAIIETVKSIDEWGLIRFAQEYDPWVVHLDGDDWIPDATLEMAPGTEKGAVADSLDAELDGYRLVQNLEEGTWHIVTDEG